MRNDIIVRTTRTCTGCRSCELACSFHQRGVFFLGSAGIRVKRDDGKGKISLILYLKDRDGHRACACPPGEEFCLRFCPAIAREELQSILSARREMR
jgi:Fe-S-cluster-containing hydrogenase component 2